MSYLVKVSRGILIPLGYQGENLARAIDFSLTIERWRKHYGCGEVHLLAQRKGDLAPYPVALDGVIWNISEADNAVPGNGKCELVYTIDNRRVVSEVWTTVTIQSLLGEAIDPPEPQESWVAQVLDAGAEAQQAAVSAESSKQAAETAQEAAETAQASAESAEETAVSKAGEATASASTASGAATAAQEYATMAGQAAETAEAAKNSAVLAKTEAETAQAASEAAQSAAESAQSAAEDARDEAVSIKEEMDAELAEEIPGIKEDIQQLQTTKVDKVNGKGLSTNDYTTTEKDKLASLENYDDTDVVKYTEQTKTNSEKAQARENINAAATDGYYETLSVGLADNLVDRKGNGNEQEFTFRTSCGDDSIADDGNGIVQSIRGNTVVWNQLIKPSGDFPKTVGGVTVTYNNGVFTANGTVTERAVIVLAKTDQISGHKYYGAGNPAGVSIGGYYIEYGGSNPWYSSWKETYVEAAIGAISVGGTGYSWSLQAEVGTVLTNVKIPLQFIDLTQMFGAGKEPSTVAEFKSMFPLDYYDYNAGELLNLNVTGLKTVGFNQWDEEWESGRFDTTTGRDIIDNTCIRSVNLIPIFPNTVYYARADVTGKPTNTAIWAMCLDANGNVISDWYAGAGNTTSANVRDIINKTFTTPSNGAYLKFYGNASYGSVYNNDICINLSWSGYRNGEYESYWENELPLPINTYFPDGMMSIKSIYDELINDRAISRLRYLEFDGSEDENWSSGTDLGAVFRFQISYSTESGYAESISNMFERALSYMADYEHHYVNAGKVFLFILKTKLGNVGTSAALRNWLANNKVTVIASLEEPIETPISPPLNLTYKVADFGTEEALPENTSEPVTSPFRAVIKYSNDYTRMLATLSKQYDTTDGLDGLLQSLSTMLGSALNGNVTITRGAYDSSTKKYAWTCTFTPQED